MESSSNAARIEELLGQRRWLRRLAASLVVDAAAADDLAQETLLVALQRPPARITSSRGWLATVARSLARRAGLGERRRHERELAAAPSELEPAADEAVARAAEQHEISAAVLALEEPYRTALVLRFVEDLAPRAIAERTGAPVETVKTRLKRGIEKVRERLIARRGARPDERALAWLALLDGAGRRAVRRALISKGGAVAAGGGAALAGAGFAGWIGAITMSTKAKLAAAVLVLAGGSAAILALREDGSEGRTAGPSSGDPPPSRAEAAVADPLPAPAEAARAPERIESPDRDGDTSSTPPAAETFAVHGIVRSSRGEPVAGALVILEPVEHGSALFGTIVQLFHNHEELRAGTSSRVKDLPRATTRSDGSFRFERIDPAANANFAALHDLEGVAIATGRVLDRAGAAVPVELDLLGGVILVGDVFDPEGAPILDAHLHVMVWEGEGDARAGSTLLMTRSDGEGSYGTPPLPFEHLTIECGGRGFTRSGWRTFDVLPGEHEHREDFELAPALRLAGRIVGLDGAPARLGWVGRELVLIVSQSDPRAAEVDPERLGTEGMVDRAAATYEALLERSARFVSLWCEGVLLGCAEVVEPDVGPDLPVDLSKAPAPPARASLVIEVADAATGEPVARYALRARRMSPDARFDYRVPTSHREVDDETGRVALGDQPIGPYEVEVRAKGFAPRLCMLELSSDPDAPVARIELHPATHAIAGRVIDEHARPVAGAEICLLGPDGRAALPFPDYRATTNSDGEFEYPAVPSGDYSIAAAMPWSAAGNVLAPAAIPARSGDRGLAITLREGVAVSISPRLEDGSSAGMYTTVVRDELGIPIHDQNRHGQWSLSAGDRFDLRLAPGSYTIEILGPTHRSDPTRFTAAPGLDVPVTLRARGE